MRVAHRLFLAVLPSFAALVLLVALAYWGQYAHQVPGAFIIVAVIGSIASGLVAWRQARYISRRIQRIASEASDTRGTRDELAIIERDRDVVSAELRSARESESQVRAVLDREREESAAVLSSVAEGAIASLDAVRMPLHILLDNRFGELNENQEEMLGAAQTAAEDADVVLRRVKLLGDLIVGRADSRVEAIKLGDMIGSMLPALRAEAEKRGVTLSVAVEPALPRVSAVRSLLQEVLTVLLQEMLRATSAGGSAAIALSRHEGQGLVLRISPTAGEMSSLNSLLVRRVLEVLRGTLALEDGARTVRLPLS
jgi:hypothetical protein